MHKSWCINCVRCDTDKGTDCFLPLNVSVSGLLFDLYIHERFTFILRPEIDVT